MVLYCAEIELVSPNDPAIWGGCVPPAVIGIGRSKVIVPVQELVASRAGIRIQRYAVLFSKRAGTFKNHAGILSIVFCFNVYQFY
jgi:hypothetical protein